MAEKDSLIPMSEMQFDPYRVKPEMFPMKSNSSAVSGQSADAAGEHDVLIRQSEQQEGPRQAEDSVERSDRDSMAERSASVSKNFKVGRNDGGAGSSVSIPEMVDFADGSISSSGYSSSPVDEVPDKLVSLGASSGGAKFRPKNK